MTNKKDRFYTCLFYLYVVGILNHAYAVADFPLESIQSSLNV
jgi:hypothetical protein